MSFEPKEGYKKSLDPVTKNYHYVPKTGRPHQFDNCWCHPLVSIKLGTVHHHYQALNKAKCKDRL